MCLCSGHSSDVTSLAWNPDATILVTGEVNQTVMVWNAVTGKFLVECCIILSLPYIEVLLEIREISLYHSRPPQVRYVLN